MVFEKISNVDRYDLKNEKFTEAFAFLKREGLEKLPIGNFELCPGVIVQVQSYETEPEAGIDYETHDCHFDIHYVIHGLEGIGVTGRDGLTEKGDYDPEKDMAIGKGLNMRGW